jgi:hypothetical protein
MGTTGDSLQEVLRRFEQESANDRDFIRLRDFYAEMVRKGLLIKKPYDLPLVDTIGRTAFQSDSQ